MISGSDMEEQTQEDDARQRPSPGRWILYAFGVGLPSRNHTWVLYDVTTRTWWLRHVARMLTQLFVPIVAVCVFVPVSAGIRVAMAVGGTFLAVIFGLAYIVETNEHRLVKAGYPAGTGQRLRSKRALEEQYAANARRRERIAARRARR
jgi:hypothetical protein